jgi:hypothetical protein
MDWENDLRPFIYYRQRLSFNTSTGELIHALDKLNQDIPAVLEMIENRFRKLEKFTMLQKLSQGELDKIIEEYKLNDRS